MKESKLFYLPINSMNQGAFGVYEMPPETENKTPFIVRPNDMIFLADGSLAGDWESLGVIRKLMCEEKNIGIACNPNDLPQLEEKQ